MTFEGLVVFDLSEYIVRKPLRVVAPLGARPALDVDGAAADAHVGELADLVDQLFNSTEKRLARVLLLLANFGKAGQPEPILAKISQETLAEMIGTTRSRVSHFMNKFRKLGFINYNGYINVHSSLLSVVLTNKARSVEPGK